MCFAGAAHCSGRITRDSERAALRVNIGSDVAIARPPGDAAHHNPCLAFGPRIQTLGISVLFVVAGQCTITPFFVQNSRFPATE